MTNEERAAAIAALGLTVESVFVPFSRSRNKDETRKTLNWKVTIKRNGRDVLTTDYSAGIARCPGYKDIKPGYGFRAAQYRSRNADGTTRLRFATEHESLSQYREAVSAAECESGFPMEVDAFSRVTLENTFKRKHKGEAIMPDSLSVLFSLTMDSSVLDSCGFEEWASDVGYDPDSRNAESIYRACLEIALKMRAAMGDSGMKTLGDIFADY
jgi:hypothetical protein